MKASAFAIIAGILLGSSARAEQPSLDWLPPPIHQPRWALERPEQPVLISDAFTHVLFFQVNEESKTDQQYLSGRVKLSREATLEAASWKSNLEKPDLQELREIPALARDWKTDQSLLLPLPIQESLFMFGQVNSNGDIDRAQNTVKSRTGVGWKWSPFSGGELQVRTGSLMTYDDLSQSRATERSQLSVQLQAKMALIGPLQLQYAGEALPAIVQADRHTLLQDLKVAVPFGTNRELSVGAKYRWDDTPSPTSWMQRAELYLGLKFQR